MKANGKMIDKMAKEYLNIKIVHILDSFKILSSMVKGNKNFQMEILTKENIKTVNQKEKEFIHGVMDQQMKIRQVY